MNLWTRTTVVVAGSLLALGVIAMPASAVMTHVVDDSTEFLAAVDAINNGTGGAASGDTIKLDADITINSNLDVWNNQIFDLNTHTLTVNDYISVPDAALHITTSDSTGTNKLYVSSDNDAGIALSDSGMLIVDEGVSLYATGADGYPGIGGEDCSSVSITNSFVMATGGENAAGIGGGNTQDACDQVTITNNSEVWVSGGSTGIGGGTGGDGDDVAIESGSAVVADGEYSAIGPGSSEAEFGYLQIVGQAYLSLEGGRFVVPDSNIEGVEIDVIGLSEVWSNVSEDEPVACDSEWLGDGQVRVYDGGVIAVDASCVLADDISVYGHNYHITFDAAGGNGGPNGIYVFGPTLAAAYRDDVLETEPTRSGYTFVGWTLNGVQELPPASLEPAATDLFDADTNLGGGSEDGASVELEAVANWEAGGSGGGLPETGSPIGAPLTLFGAVALVMGAMTLRKRFIS